jgi:RNA polymerase sigma-70 factor, ECF subfamily
VSTADLADFDHAAALAACASGDRRALRQLYEREGARLLGVVHRIVRDAALAEDIVHDAFVRVWTHAGSFDPGKGAARGWIYSIARNLALNAIRDGAREVSVDDDTMAALDAEASVQSWQTMVDHFAWQASEGRIRHCLTALEPVRRNCVLYAYVDGLSHSEIAARLQAPLGTVKAWIKRSLATLRECMT